VIELIKNEIGTAVTMPWNSARCGNSLDKLLKNTKSQRLNLLIGYDLEHVVGAGFV